MSDEPAYLQHGALARIVPLVEKAITDAMPPVEGEGGRLAVDFGRGHKAKPRLGRPPRITWVDAGAEYEGAGGPGAPGRRQGQGERTLWRRLVTLECHLWGTSEDGAYELLEETLRAFQSVMPGAYKPVSDEPDEHAEDNRKQGFLVVLTVQVDTNILARALVPTTPKVVVEQPI